eukprot:jgi/Mesen1/9982/ME000072S09398
MHQDCVRIRIESGSPPASRSGRLGQGYRPIITAQGSQGLYAWSSSLVTSGSHRVDVTPIPKPQEALGAAVVGSENESHEQKQEEEGEQASKKDGGGGTIDPSDEGRESGEVITSSKVPYRESDDSEQSGEESKEDATEDATAPSVVQGGSRDEEGQSSDHAAGPLHATEAKALQKEEDPSREHGAEPGSDVEIVFADTPLLPPPLPQRAPQKGHQGDEGEVFACDRSMHRSDECRMRGDVRVKGDSQVLWLFSRNQTVPRGTQKIKPYPRKMDGYSMGKVSELVLKCIDDHTQQQQQQQQQPLQQGGGQGEGAEGTSRRLLKARSNAHEHLARLHEEEEEEEGLRSSHSEVLAEGKEGGAQVSSRGGSAQLGEWRGDEEAEWDRSPFMLNGPREWKMRKWLGAWSANGTVSQWPPGSLQGPPPLTCHIRHHVPAIMFSIGGYSGNIFHDFNEGLIPLWMAAQQYKREVVLVISDARDWWIERHWEPLDQLSNYPPVLLGQDPRVHCFPEATVGITADADLAVNPGLMPNNETIHDFQAMLRRAWDSKVTPAVGGGNCSRPQMAIIARTAARSFTNQEMLVQLAEGLGYAVRIIDPAAGVSLADMWGHMQRSAVVMGVHGAAMTHLLFMRPGSFFIQVIPLGVERIAKDAYGNPAMKLGLHYVAYNITVQESTLSKIYAADDPVLTDPDSIWAKGWDVMGAIYLSNQNVTLSEERVGAVLRRVMKALESDAARLKHYC